MIRRSRDGRVLGDASGEFRLLLYTDDAGGDQDACHTWRGRVDRYGYGTIRVGGRTRQVHRVAFELAHGAPPAPDGDGAPAIVRHTCDNRLCLNPAHLVQGTRKDNMDDMVSRGRSLAGGRNPNAKFTQDQRGEIVARYLGGERQVDLRREYGLSPAGIHYIVKGLHQT